MQLGVIGLGRMGANIVRRLLRNNHECVVFNRTPEKVKQLASEGAIAQIVCVQNLQSGLSGR